ncbi:Uncharacterized protein LACOL_1500 [Paucilactobacillus oligofermentans DSM 15707 = LMG 22743]|nr:helix-turn-helix domain-containing protein [Paucilactobacillus oligofermentans]CUS26830.1 Uncharacterized protein LACOL_1500 [Paucilactobacillus oligofermentans DSM 15707 = LMG 22743]
MKMNLEVPNEFEEQIKVLMYKTASEAFESILRRERSSEWMTKKDAAVYAGISFNTIAKFINGNGLKVSNVAGVQRISRKTLDQFLIDHEK